MAILYEATGGGGHEMIPWTENSDNDISALAALSDGSEDKVINAYTAQRWANCDVTTLMTTAAQGTDTMGLWEDSFTWKNYNPATDDPYTYRAGWLYHTALFGVLDDTDVEITPIFDMDKSEVVSLYAMRIDDGIYLPVPSGSTGNPSALGWFEKSGSTFVASTDTTVTSGKTYYVGVGAVAFLFNTPIYTASGVKVGLKLTRQRINELTLTPLT